MSATDFLERRTDEHRLRARRLGLARQDASLERRHRHARGWGRPSGSYVRDRAAIQRDFDGPRTVAFLNPKGGAAKTTSVLVPGYTFGTVRGGGIVAWDNNETRGTLGHPRPARRPRQHHARAAGGPRAVQRRLPGRGSATSGAFVRSQGDAHFDVLASDERPHVTGVIHASDFTAVHQLLERFYRLILVDTGNNMRAENWLAAAETADLLVVTTTVREDTGYTGLWMLDALQDAGYQDLKHHTITILSEPASEVDEQLAAGPGRRLRAAHQGGLPGALRPGAGLRVGGALRTAHATRPGWRGSGPARRWRRNSEAAASVASDRHPLTSRPVRRRRRSGARARATGASP